MTSETPATTGTELDQQRNAPPLTGEEAQRIVSPGEPWSDARAKDFVKKTFQRYETYRIQNYDKGYKRCDDTYMAVTKNKTWEGTRIPRASIPVWMGVQQIEALLPHAVGALFSDDFPFECFPKAGTTLQAARAVRDLLREQIEDLNPDVMGMTLREIVRRAYKSDYVYGVAPVEFGWQMAEKKRMLYSRKAIPERVPMRHPQTGEVVMVPSGEIKWAVDQQTKTYRISRPKVQNTEVYDYYFDPNLKSHNPQEGQGVATRQLLPISYLKQVCIPEFGYKLPADDKAWQELAQQYKSSMAEVGKGWSEQNRGNYYNPAIDQNADPADARVEVIRFWTKDRHVWLIGRDWLAYNWPNELGVIPFLNPFYVDVIGRHVGLSICDLIEGDQKLAQAIIEARIDELNLMIHPPIIRKFGVKVASSQRRLRPGVEWEADNPKEDIARMEMGNVTQSAYIEVQALEQRVQKTTGVTDLAALGAPSSSGNSANRTATGINTQSAATGVRIGYQVENGEDQFITPLLQMLLLLNQKYQDPNDMAAQPFFNVAMPNGQVEQVDPLDILNAQVKFKLKSSDKLRIRRMLAGGGLGEALQFISSMQGMMQSQGQTADLKEVGALLTDALGLPSNSLFRDMTQQEMESFAAQAMAKEQAKFQLQGARLESMEEMSESKDETKLLGEIFKKLLTPEVVAVIAKENGASEILDLLKKKSEPKPAAPKKASGK
jgi:hypothetical protein